MTKLEFIALIVFGLGFVWCVGSITIIMIAGYRQAKAQERRIREHGERIRAEIARGSRLSRPIS